jgi:signal transduction histidine kinase
LSVIALVGWLSGAPILTTLLPDRPPLFPATALGLLIAARALAVIEAAEEARKLAIVQVLVGLATMGAHLSGFAETDVTSPWSWPSRWTGVAFTVSGLSTWLLASGKSWEGQCVAFLTLLFLMLLGFGHLVPRADLYKYLPGSGVSIPTILAFIALSAGQLLSFAEEGITAALTRRSLAGRMGLRLIFGGLLVPFVLCFLIIGGYRRQMFDVETAVVLMSWSAMVVLGAMLWGLAIAVDRAERARRIAERDRNSLRQMLIAALTHDVRSPLQVATVSTAVLLTCADDKQRAAVIARLQKSHRRIDRLLRSLLDSLALESGQDLKLRPHLFDLVALVREVVAENDDRLRDRVIVEGEPLLGWWDQDALFRVVENLLLNAIKYGDRSSTIVCRVDATSAERVCLRVTNRGAPIPREEWELIFQPFARGHDALHSGHVGWGVGLAYARAVVTKHGGRIEVESSGEDGTTFAVMLPIDARTE